MPAYMVPAGMRVLPGPLPRNPNGKIDRKGLLEAYRAGAFPDPSALAADADREGSGQ